MVSFQTILNYLYSRFSSSGSNRIESQMRVSVAFSVVVAVAYAILDPVAFGIQALALIFVVAGALPMREVLLTAWLDAKDWARKGKPEIVVVAPSSILSNFQKMKIQTAIVFEQRATERSFSALGLIHLALFSRLTPTPILSRA